MPFPSTIGLATLSAGDGFFIQGDASFDSTGHAVSLLGDINGDGIDDIILSSARNGAGGHYAGLAYVIYGSRDGFGVFAGGRQTLDLTGLTPDQGFILLGEDGSQTGWSVSAAGDVNGDGIEDMIVGAPYGGVSREGAAYVVFGTRDGFGSLVGGQQVLDLATLSASEGFAIFGDAASDVMGRSVSAAGDVNGDGIDDVIVGADEGDDGGNRAGEAYVVFGTRGAFGTNVGGRQLIDLTSVTASQGFVIQGDSPGFRTGGAVSAAGDINGDGIGDVIVGAKYASDLGEAYVVFGTRAGFGSNVGGRQVIDIGSLAAGQGFVIRGDSDFDSAGYSVSAAGDINGDGIGDLIIGAYQGDDGGTRSGEAYVVFGSLSGFGSDVGGRQLIDLTTLTPAQGFIVQGQAGDMAGYRVSAAGDVNADGIDDLLIGAPDAGDVGTAYILYGSTAGFGSALGGRQVFDLSSFTSAHGAVVPGDASVSTIMGGPLAGGRDVNGDGIADMILGAARNNLGGTDAGGAYVVFGQAAEQDAPFPLRIDLTTLSATDGFVIQGDAAGDYAGYSVSNAGDVNGDGIDDVIVGAKKGDDGGTDAGEAYVVFGTTAGFGSDVGGRQVIDLTSLTAAQGFIVQGHLARDDTGRSVSSAGDVNGDGIDDLIVGAALSDGGATNGGEAYIVFGTRDGFGSGVGGRQVLDLSTLTAAQGFIVRADSAHATMGHSVSAAGDLNGDGIDDIIVGMPAGDIGGDNAGEAYVIFGTRDGFGTAVGGRQVLSVTGLTADQGFLIVGDAAGDLAAISVSSAGDVNGDGIDDLIVGGYLGDDGGSDAGEAYIVFGTRAGFGSDVGGRQVIDLTSLTASQGFIVQGDGASDHAGASVSSAGDVNGDGIVDLIVGAIAGDDGGLNAGETYVVFGTRAGFGSDVGGRQVVDLTTLGASQGFILQGDVGNDQAGGSVSAAGDVNGDGIGDLIIGAIGGDGGGTNAGEAYVIFGSRDGFGVDVGGRRVIDLASLTASQGFAVHGDTAGDQMGNSVSAAGDVNGDGIDDLIVGAAYGDDGGAEAGEAYVIFGRRVAPAGNAAPTQGANTGSTVNEGGQDIITASELDFNDAEQADSAIVYTVTSAMTNGALRLNGTTLGVGGTFTQDDIANNRVTFLHDGSETTGASFGFSVSDGQGGTVTGQSFAVTVNPVNDTPTGTVPALVTTAANTPVAITGLSLNDAETDPALDSVRAKLVAGGGATIQIRTDVPGGMTAGQLVNNGTGGIFFDATLDQINATFAAANGVILTPASGYTGSFQILLGMTDGGASGADPGGDPTEEHVDLQFDVTVEPGNSAPTQGVNAGLTLAEGASGTITAALLAFDDAEQDAADVVYTVTTAATNGTLRLDGSALGLGATFTQDDIDNGRVTFLHDGSETIAASFGFSVGDGEGETVAGQSFAVTVTPVDDAPVAANDAFDTDELTAKAGNLLADNGSGADADPDSAGALTIGSVNGSAGNVGVRVVLASGAWLTVNADGTFSYDPHGRFEPVPASASGGSNLIDTDSFTYALTGGGTATVTIRISGVDNDDTVEGTGGNDALAGGTGTNTVSYANAAAGVHVALVAGPQDTIGAGIDTLAGFANLTGSDFVDELRGSAAANILDGGLGADVMLGGLGDDTYLVDDAGDSIREAAGQGTDTVRSLVTYTLPDREVETLILIGTAAINGGGNRHDNVLQGNGVANVLAGYGGDDSLDGRGGADLMKGGTGNDRYVVDHVGDRVWEWDGEGTDTVWTYVDYTLPDCEIEGLRILGSDAVNLTGNAIGNLLTGNSAVNWINGAGGNDRIDGGGGADVMAGGLGNDVFVVDNAGDRIKESADQGTDTVESAITFSLQGLEVENLTLTGSSTIDGTGNGLANLIIGNNLANALLGYEGADDLRGGWGDDALHGMAGNDVMEGGGGADRFYFDATLDGADNVDTIADFEAGVDSIWLRRAKFDGMALGALSADAFAIGSEAGDASDRIIYDAATGALYFDPDGTGAAAAVQFATLDSGLSLSHADFTVF